MSMLAGAARADYESTHVHVVTTNGVVHTRTAAEGQLRRPSPPSALLATTGDSDGGPFLGTDVSSGVRGKQLVKWLTSDERLSGQATLTWSCLCWSYWG